MCVAVSAGRMRDISRATGWMSIMLGVVWVHVHESVCVYGLCVFLRMFVLNYTKLSVPIECCKKYLDSFSSIDVEFKRDL